MKLSLDQLDAFYALGKLLHFSKAAQSIHLSQPAFSQRIKSLEETLQTTLVVREKSNIRLTLAGQRLLRHCERQRDLETQFFEELHHGKDRELTGEVHLGLYSSVYRSLVLSTLAPLAKQYPNLAMHFYCVEVKDLLPLLKRGQVDTILINQIVPDSDLEFELLGYEEYVLVQSKDHQDCPCYLDQDEHDQTTLSYFRHLDTKEMPLRRRFMGDVYSLIEGVKLGYGKAILPRHLITQEESLQIDNSERSLKEPVYLAYYKQPFYTKLQKALRGLLKDEIPKLLKREDSRIFTDSCEKYSDGITP